MEAAGLHLDMATKWMGMIILRDILPVEDGTRPVIQQHECICVFVCGVIYF